MLARPPTLRHCFLSFATTIKTYTKISSFMLWQYFNRIISRFVLFYEELCSLRYSNCQRIFSFKMYPLNLYHVLHHMLQKSNSINVCLTGDCHTVYTKLEHADYLSS